MTKMRNSIKMRGMNLLHFVLLTGTMIGAWFLWCAPLLDARNAQTVSLAVCTCYVVCSIFLLRTYNAYKIGIFRAGEVFYAQTLANLFSNGITYVFACLIQLRLLPVWPVLVVFCGQTFVCAVWCLAANKLYFKLHPPMKTLIIYQSESDLEKLHEIVHFENRFDVQKKLKMPAMLYDILQAMNGYQAVIVSGVEATLRNGIVKECIDKDINCYFIPHTGDVIIAGAKHLQSFSVPIMSAKRATLRPEYALAKRALDILLAMIGLILASPFMLITAVAIKAYDHGPVLYKQIRLTKDGKCFKILKFRSMRVDAEKDGVARLAADHDDRITPVGRIIRAIRFDELPQIINILMGDMSIVGPRPERPKDEWQPDFFTIDERNLYVDGYFQSENYFKQDRAELLKQIQPKYAPEDEYLRALEEIKKCNSVAVHVRRSDFKKDNCAYHYLLDESYYEKAIQRMRELIENPVFFWFSDDMEWVKEHIGEADDFRFVRIHTQHGDVDDMMLMKNCHHIIAANSTFSWWAAWLNEHDDTVRIVPEKPYGMEGMIPPDWEKV